MSEWGENKGLGVGCMLKRDEKWFWELKRWGPYLNFGKNYTSPHSLHIAKRTRTYTYKNVFPACRNNGPPRWVRVVVPSQMLTVLSIIKF